MSGPHSEIPPLSLSSLPHRHAQAWQASQGERRIMSTPTTATATLPPCNQLHYPFSRPHHQPYQDPNTATYRVGNPSLPSSSQLAYPSSGYFASSNGSPRSNVISISSSSTARPVPQEQPPIVTARTEAEHTNNMPAVAQAHTALESQPARKRRRSREPDWNTFYKNGLPAEVIIIDDSPEPSQKPAAGTVSSTTTLPGNNGGPISSVSNTTSARHVAKKRKRDDEPAHYDPVYHSNLVSSHATTPHQISTPSKSTISTDRTNSAIHTTAATSLDSLSSTGGQYNYDTQAGQKRKRTTRQQVATEARRREAGALADAYTSYQPPPYPPKKAADVHVKVISDVGVTTRFLCICMFVFIN